eukprot:Platyproteum_vivax@DN913_c0_g1_i1.p2
MWRLWSTRTSSSRPYWRCYYPNTNGIIYVVDSADSERLEDSRQELTLMLQEEELKGVCLVIFANKQDLPGAMTVEQLTDGLGLTELRGRQWAIFETSAVKGSGVNDGLDWLANVISSK